MPALRGSGLYQALRFATVAGGAAGPLTVTGIKLKDRLIAVIDAAAASANLASEFSITAADTVDNTGGTDTTGMVLIFIWESYAGGRYEDRLPEDGGRFSNG